jgi:hypothetical protein
VGGAETADSREVSPMIQALALVALFVLVALAVDLFAATLGPRDWEATAKTFCLRCGRP